MTRARAAFSSLLLGALCFAPATAQEPAQNPQRTAAEQTAIRHGTELFRRMLFDMVEEQGLAVLEHPRQLRTDAEDTLLILLGDTSVLERLRPTLSQFAHDGGAVLVASDQDTGPERLPGEFGYRVSGKRVVLSEDQKARGYRGLAECPFVRPVAIGDAAAVFAGFSKIATNRPGHLQQLPGQANNLPTLALFQNGCRLENGDAPLIMRFAAGGTWGAGRILLLADHSVFINEMLYQPDMENDNLLFAFATLHWLTDRGNGQRRTRVLFYEDGVIQTKFDIPGGEIPLPAPPPLGAIIQAVNQGLRGLEEEDVFNRLLLSRFERLNPNEVLRGLLIVVTVAICLYVLARLGQARHQIDPGTPLLDIVLLRSAATGGVAEQRRRELLAQGNFRDPARALARQWFDGVLGLTGVSQQGLRPFGPALTGSWWQRRTMSRKLDSLWRYAQGRGTGKVSARQLAHLRRDIEFLDAAINQGMLRIEPANKL